MIATADVQFHNVVLFVHILSVVLAFGPTFAYGLFIAIAQREGGVAVPAVGRAIGKWDMVAGTIGMTLILFSGMYLASYDGSPWEFSQFFVSWGFVAILVLFGHGPRLLHPADEEGRRPGRARPRERATASSRPSSRRRAPCSRRSAPVAGMIVILTIYVMSAKPFL